MAIGLDAGAVLCPSKSWLFCLLLLQAGFEEAGLYRSSFTELLGQSPFPPSLLIFTGQNLEHPKEAG